MPIIEQFPTEWARGFDDGHSGVQNPQGDKFSYFSGWLEGNAQRLKDIESAQLEERASSGTEG